MKKNLYFKQVVKRNNPFNLFIFGVFYNISSYPRLLLEVFTRKNFGERYFSMGSVIMATMIFAYIPKVIFSVTSFVRVQYMSTEMFWKEYATWYIFLTAFVVVSIKRWKEVKRETSTFDFSKYTLDRGRINSFFFDLPIFKKRPDIRRVEILVEPGFFFIIGLLLALVGQGGGLIIIICSLLYSLSYAIDYKVGDDYVLDITDQMHLNFSMMRMLQKDADSDDQSSYNFRGRRPANPNDWQVVVDATIIDDKEDLGPTIAI